MTPSSEEHLRRIQAQTRDEAGAEAAAEAEAASAATPGPAAEPTPRSPAPGKRRGAALLAGAALALVLGLGLTWLAIERAGDLVVGRLVQGGAEAGDPGGRILAWWLERQAAMLTAPSGDDRVEAFEVAQGEPLPAVAERLQAAGFIRDADAFRLLARVKGLDTGVQAGTHQLSRAMPAEAVLTALQVAPGESVTVTLREGLRAEEVASILANMRLAERQAFLDRVLPGADAGLAVDPARHPLVAARPAGANLEGYLFPDTYELEPEAGADPVLERLLDTFEARVRPVWEARPADAPASLHETVILASIVEREAALPEERGRIARVYRNRLETPPYILNADPTLQYALGFQPEANSWWKRPLYEADLQIASPYNSYQNPGLPPGPIASPGLASIEAVLKPEPGPWQYFVANDQACDGSHVFAVTYEEHLANVARYQTGACGQ